MFGMLPEQACPLKNKWSNVRVDYAISLPKGSTIDAAHVASGLRSNSAMVSSTLRAAIFVLAGPDAYSIEVTDVYPVEISFQELPGNITNETQAEDIPRTR